MKTFHGNKAQSWLLAVILLLPLSCVAGQFLDLTAEIEINDFDYWFFTDRPQLHPGENHTTSIFNTSQTRHCVVGSNTWMIEGNYPTFKTTWWFTGTNIVHHTLTTKEMPDADVKKWTENGKVALSFPHVGEQYTTVLESLDGNPGRPVRVADLMSFDMPATVCWMAFCSGSFLKTEGRKINPPSAFWKESSIVDSGWTDQTVVYEDGLGLPTCIRLITTNDQPIFEYQVRQSTNVLGWNFPLEFYAVQYLPSGTNRWKLHETMKGRITSIGIGSKPSIPDEVMKAAHR